MTAKAAFRADIPSELSEVDGVCRATRALLEKNGLEKHIFVVDLLLREFINNAILHGNGSGSYKRVRVSVRIHQHTIVLAVADEGTGFDWRAQMRKAPETSDVSGRGLAIGMEYAKRIKYNRSGNRVVLTIGNT